MKRASPSGLLITIRAILWNSVTSLETVLSGNSVKTRLCMNPSPILDSISYLGDNKGCQGHWVSQNSRGGLGELAHFLYFDTAFFSHLSYYTFSCGFAKKRPCQTTWTLTCLIYFICIMMHSKSCSPDLTLPRSGILDPCSRRLKPCLGELGHTEYVGTDTTK